MLLLIDIDLARPSRAMLPVSLTVEVLGKLLWKRNLGPGQVLISG